MKLDMNILKLNCMGRMITVITYIVFVLSAVCLIPCQCLKCYQCSGQIPCGQGHMDLMMDCPGKCMVHRNELDNTIVRRCCASNCGPSNSVSIYENRLTYFCSTDRCNEVGSETMLTGGTTSTSTTVTSLQCYDCSGVGCGQEGSQVAMNCPMCMVYRNPDDQSKIERHCCRSNCGSPLSVSIYNGIQTYFCAYDKCNKYGSETILSPPVTRSTSTTTTTTTTTTSPARCTLNCRNGGTLESIDGCFCYCAEKTSGRECENIDCARPDDSDPYTCLPENRSLCGQSEIFTFKCLHLCGKC